MESRNVEDPVPETAVGLARRTAAGVVVAVVSLLVVQALVDAAGLAVGPSGPRSPFAAAPLVGSAVVAGAGAAVAYALAVTYTERPVRNFLAVSAAVFAVMLVPVAVVSPAMGVTPLGQAVLVLYHLLVAVPLVAFVASAVEV